MTVNLKVGERVKLTQRAFENGLFEASKASRALRGVVARKAQQKDRVAVRWDGKKTVELLWHEFVNRCAYDP